MVLGGDADVTDRAPTGATTTDTGRSSVRGDAQANHQAVIDLDPMIASLASASDMASTSTEQFDDSG